MTEQQKYLPIAVPSMGEEEWQALRDPITSGWLTQGPKVAEFEKMFAKRHGVSHALATTSCTTALHLAMLAVGVKPGDLVIVPSFTWVATANAVEYCGATPVLCDCDIDTYNIDIDALAGILATLAGQGKTVKAVAPVHLFGLCADMAPITALAKQYGFKIVEDAACAIGAAYDGRPAGSLGDVGCFSFHPRKTVTTGEGGMCTTSNVAYAESIACLRSHGASLSEEQRHSSNRPYLMADFEVLGYNYRMSDLQGAVGVVQLRKLDTFVAERRQLAAYYDKHLADLDWLATPKVPANCEHSYQSYVCRVKPDKLSRSRNDVMEYLHQNGIGSRAGTHSLHQLGYYARKYGIDAADFPAARELYANTLALPLHNRMTEADCRRVVDTLEKMPLF